LKRIGYCANISQEDKIPINKELCMQSVTVSPKFQVVIPRTIRKSLELHAGQKMQVFLYNNRIEMIPVRPIKEARGFLKGIDTSVPREKDRI